MRKIQAVTVSLQCCNDLAGIAFQRVVDGAVVAAAGPLVIDTETATDIDDAEWCAESAQLGIVTSRFRDPGADVAQAGNL